MSRSYRHTPCLQDNRRHSKKWARNQAARRIRRTQLEEVADHGHYKKFYEQWDICDYAHYCTLNDYLDSWSRYQSRIDNEIYAFGMYVPSENWYGKTIQKAIQRWKKFYYRK